MRGSGFSLGEFPDLVFLNVPRQQGGIKPSVKLDAFESALLVSCSMLLDNSTGALAATAEIFLVRSAANFYGALAATAVGAAAQLTYHFALGSTIAAAVGTDVMATLGWVMADGNCSLTLGWSGGDGSTTMGGANLVLLARRYKNKRV